MAAVEQWQSGHDRLCATRYEQIGTAITGLKGGINKAVWLLISVLLSLAGWMAVQLWSGQQAEIHRLRDAPAAIEAAEWRPALPRRINFGRS